MKKVFKSLITTILAAAILVTSFAGCSGSNSTASTAASSGAATASSGKPTSIAPFKIGFPFLTSNDPTYTAILNSAKTVCKAAGGELVTASWDFTPDQLVTDVQKLISMGCNGIMIIPTSDSVLPKIKQMCETAKVPFSIVYRSINDPDIKAAVESSPYYVGNCWEDEENTGYQVMKQLSGMGAKNVALLGVNKGDTTGDARDRGIQKAAKEDNVKILAETRGIMQSADATKAVESFIAAYPEMDGLYIVGGSICPGILEAATKALAGHGKTGKVKIGMIDFSSGIGDALSKKELSVVAGGHMVLDPTLSCTMLVNKVIGTPLSDKPVSLSIKLMYIKNAEDAANYFKYVEGSVPPFTEDEIKKDMLKFYNPTLNKDGLDKINANFSVQDVMTRHKGLVK
ncbi:MAG TPA: sugar ABC transporter substrate-binding protein [Caproiciproducens sp.]|nr:sugar ABC transporter substrate-binding protein [Caproiciproducens sp.]